MRLLVIVVLLVVADAFLFGAAAPELRLRQQLMHRQQDTVFGQATSVARGRP